MGTGVNAGGRGLALIAAAFIVLGATACYFSTLHFPFIFDDVPAIVENPTIRSLATAWSPPAGGSSVSGRPLANFSLAASQLLGRGETWGFHAVNLVIHAMAGLAFFGVVRRTLLLGAANSLPARAGEGPRDRFITCFAASIAAWWTLHPLQTESVTYIVQRAESLVGLCYFLALYAFIRAARSPRPAVWAMFSVAACLAGMASKEVMASAPLVIFLYDRTFIGGTFRRAWRERWRIHACLASTWVLLTWLVLATGTRGGTAGFGVNITPLAYALTQTQAIVRYLGLSLWPHPLVFDYGTYLAGTALAIVPFVAVVVLLLAGSVIAWRRWPVAGFLGAAFFLILAPTSSIVPVATQTMAEHRMYLPLAAVVTLVAWTLFVALGQRAIGVVALLALAAGGLTYARNEDYRTAFSLWADTVAKRPANDRARYILALEFLAQHKAPGAIAQMETAVRLDPANPVPRVHLALILLQAGQAEAAIAQGKEALLLAPGMGDAHAALGSAYLASDRPVEAIAELERAIADRPDSPAAFNNLGGALAKIGRLDEAVLAYDRALLMKPLDASARANRGDALRQLGRFDEAAADLDAALRLRPDLAEAHYGLGNLYLRTGRLPDALSQFEQAIRLKPGYADAELLLGSALLQLGRTDDGLVHFGVALQLAPRSFEAHFNYANALFQLGRVGEAIEHYAETLRLKPRLVRAHVNLGHALLAVDRLPGAIREFETAARLEPANVDVRYNLGLAWLQAGRAADAAREFEEVLRLRPGDPGAKEKLAETRAAIRPQAPD